MVVTEGGEHDVDLRVEACDRSIAGTVVDEAGGPLSDAFISLVRDETHGASSPGRWGGPDPIVSDPDGRFEVEALPRGTYSLRAFRRGGGEGLLEGIEAGDADVVIAIEAVGTLGGRIDSDGLHGSCMLVAREPTLELDRREFPPRGASHWVVEDLPPGTYDVDLLCDRGTAERRALALAPGEHRDDVRLSLQPRATLRGRVAWDDGSPAVGVVVYANKTGLISNFPMPDEEHGEELTDAQGRYIVRDAPTGQLVVEVVGASLEDWASFPGAKMEVRVAPGETAELDDLVVAKPD